MGCYARFVTNYPWVIILIDVIVVLVCGPIGVWQAGAPNFKNPNKGYEPRGTDIRGRDLANTRFVANMWSGNYTTLPNSEDMESGDNIRNRRDTHTTTCINEIIQGVAVRALPPPLRATLKQTESTALPRLVIQPKDATDSMWSAEYMKSICDLEYKYITSLLQVSCAAHSLPYYIGALQNKTCSDINQSDMEDVMTLLMDCSQFYFNGDLSCTNKSCDNIPDKCLQYNAVSYILNYFTDIDFFKDGDISKHHLSYSLIIFRRSWSIDSDKLYNYYLDNLQGKALEKNMVEVKAIDMDIIVKEMNTYYVLTDLPYYGLAMALVVLVLFIYLRSFTLMLVVMLNVGLTLAVSYFIYHVVCRFKYFGFTNLLAGLLLIAIGADDVFIFFDIWQKIKSKAPDPKNINIEDLTSHTIHHAFLSILVTSLTTSAALFANGINDVIALRCFGIFGGICMIVNLFFMVTLVPGALVILEKVTRKYPCCNCEWANKLTEPLNRLSKYCWGNIVPLIVIKGSVLWLILLLGVGVYGFVVVFYSPQLRLPSSETFQIFYSGHPFEVYRFKFKEGFRFEVKNKETSKVNIHLNFVFGIDGKDNGNVIDPDDTGVLKLDSNFNMYPKENQIWLQKFCRNLLMDDQVLDSSIYSCFMDVYHTVLTSGCTYEKYNITLNKPCCMSKFPLSTSEAKTCLKENDFLQVINNLKRNGSKIIGQPVYDLQGNLIAVYFQVETKMHWSPQYSIMNDFYNHYIKFMKDELKTAPNGLTDGWFSGAFGRELYFYDYQSVMVKGAVTGLGLSMAVAFFIMLITSGNFFITLYAILTIVIVIAVTVAILVLLGWELGVQEALVITLTVGLSIDFTIHFGVAYKVSPSNTRKDKVKDAISTVGFAVTMAALTTFLAGASLMGGRVLSYYRFGVFLMLDMVVSWVFAMFFFMPLCRIIGPVSSIGDLSVLCNVLNKYRGKKVNTNHASVNNENSYGPDKTDSSKGGSINKAYVINKLNEGKSGKEDKNKGNTDTKDTTGSDKVKSNVDTTDLVNGDVNIRGDDDTEIKLWTDSVGRKTLSIHLT